jgi:hypothetical protein
MSFSVLEMRRRPVVISNCGVRSLAEDDPGGSRLARGEFGDDGLAVAEGELGAELLGGFSGPGEGEGFVVGGGGDAVGGFVGLHVAVEVLSRGGAGDETECECCEECFHWVCPVLVLGCARRWAGASDPNTIRRGSGRGQSWGRMRLWTDGVMGKTPEVAGP